MLVTEVLALKLFGAIIGFASSRQGQIYGIVNITSEKGYTDPRTGARYDEYFLKPQQMKGSFKGFEVTQDNTLI